MTRTEEQEYRRLELESSNPLMEQDGRRVLGQYAESALERGCIPAQRVDLLAILQRRKQEVREFIRTNGSQTAREPRNGSATSPAEAVQKKDG